MQRDQHMHRRHRRRLILTILIVLVVIFGLHHFLSVGARLKANWNKIVYTSSDNVAIAVYSPKTHRTYTSTNAPTINSTQPVPSRSAFLPVCFSNSKPR